jgi:type IV secretory pathway VirB4 component
MGRAGQSAGTTYSASFVLPPHSVPERLPCAQVPIGCNLLNRRETVYFDPFVLYQTSNPQILSDRNIAFIGHVGNGKSSMMKTFLSRMLCLPDRLEQGSRRRRAVIIDRKGEYKRLAESFACRPVVVGHGVCINPLDDRLTDQQQLAVLGRFVGLLLDRMLDGFENECILGAYNQAHQEHRSLTLDDIRHALMTLSDEFVVESLRTRTEVNRTASELAFAIKHLTTGSLRGMFNGSTTDAFDWTGQVIDIVIHPDYLLEERELVYQLLVACVSVWLDQAWRADDDERVDFLVVDEGWDAAKARQFGQLLQDWTKLGRSRGVCVMLALHGPSDYESAGNAGEQQVATAKRALMEIGSFVLFNMRREEANRLRGIAHLSDEDVDTITDLQPHQFLLTLGVSGMSRRRFLVEHRLAEHEVPLVDSDR